MADCEESVSAMTLERIREAADVIRRSPGDQFKTTPLVRYRMVRGYGVDVPASCDLFLKLENMQITGEIKTTRVLKGEIVVHVSRATGISNGNATSVTNKVIRYVDHFK